MARNPHAVAAMNRAIPAVVLLLLWPLMVGLSPEECAEASRAHANLREASFSVERSFRMSVNGKLKKRELAQLAYSAGELETEGLDEEVLSKNMVFEGGEGKDFALDADFACERVRGIDGGRIELASEDGLEVVVFELDRERNALRPVSWSLDTTERFLFKKFVVDGRAEYSSFVWRASCGELRGADD